MARFTITINATLNGKTCKNPQIEFIQGSDVIYPCEISGNQITIETLPGTNPNACIEGYIKCDDDCLNCPPQYFKKCLCNDITLLNSCQICKDGLIEEICTPEEIAAGKICSPNGCICPPDKPVTDPNTGQCVECITGTVQGCKICVAGQWTTLECGPNERCVDGECQCTPPYVKDPVTGECKLQDECLDDADCPTCQTCISGKCEPVKCPEGFQCINDECVPACTNVNCNNGADCGENCGCLDGKCVPCTILSCLDEASCQAALGCKCNGDKCTPVDNCNQNCEDNPCVDPGCTCYNGECVNCENFPCTDAEGGCNSYYNCQCNDEGKCEGGKDCEDTFELKKKEVCSADGCELEAVYNTKNKCMCDPIEFRVRNTEGCLTQDPTGTGESLAGDTLLRLSIEMFKKGIAYANFKTSDKFSDNEIVTGSIKVVVNAGGVTLPAITSTITANNIVPSINIPKPQSLPANNKKVKVSVFTQSIKVNDNGCTNYDNKEIATYEFDLAQSATIYCAKQNQYKTAKVFKLEDSVSTKKPLIVWYRTSGTDFGTTPVSLTSTDYAAKGYFRKKYLTGVAGSFSDKISKPEEGLLNNFRYKTTIDCGCEGANVATTGDVVIFCCPKDFAPKISNCGRKFDLDKFDSCSTNRNLGTSKYPQESQTYYYAIINGGEKEFFIRPDGGNLITSMTSYNHDKAITSIVISQRYKGNAVIKKAENCDKEYKFEPNLPEYDYVVECNNILVRQKSGNPSISSVTATVVSTGQNVNFVLTNGAYIPNTSQANLLNISGDIDLTVKFNDSTCVRTDRYRVNCGATVILNPEGTVVAKCSPTQSSSVTTGCGGTAELTAKALTVFTAACEFLDPTTNQWVKPDTTSPEITKKFNLPPGKYKIKVRETFPTGEVNAETNEVVVEFGIDTFVSAEPVCGNAKGKIRISGTKCGTNVNLPKGVTYSVKSVNTTPPFSTTFTTDGTKATYEIEVPSAGAYNVKMENDLSYQYPEYGIKNGKGLMCAYTAQTVINSTGGTVNPTIKSDSENRCQGSVSSYAIRNGEGLTYTISVDGGYLVASLTDETPVTNNNIVSIDSGFNFYVKSAGDTVIITITGVVGDSDCVTLPTPKPIYYTYFTPGQYLVSYTAECVGVGQAMFYVTTKGSFINWPKIIKPDGSEINMINSGPNTWKTGIPIDFDPSRDEYATLILNKDVSTPFTHPCFKTYQIAYPKPCDGRSNCPTSGSVNIVASPQQPTCGDNQTTTVSFIGSSLGVLDGYEYAWYEVIGSNEFLVPIIGDPNPGIVGTGNDIPSIQVASTPSGKNYKLRISIYGEECYFDSNIVQVISGGEVNSMVAGPGIPPDVTTISQNTPYQYFANFYQDAVYTWTLTLPDSSVVNLASGLGIDSVTVNSFQPGANILSLTITKGECTSTSNYTINVQLNCDSYSVALSLENQNPTAASCSNVVGTVGNPLATVIVSHEWSFDSGSGPVVIQSGAGAPTVLNTSVIPAGDTGTITLAVTFANGCVKSNPVPFSYTRCACICDVGVCSTSVLKSGSNGFGTLLESGVYNSNTKVKIETKTQTVGLTNSDRYRIIIHDTLTSTSTTIVDTGYIYDDVSITACPYINYNSEIRDLGAYVPVLPATYPVNLGVGTSVLPFVDSNVYFDLGLTTPGIALNDLAVGELYFYYDVPAGSYVEIQYNDSLCSSQKQYFARITCV